MTLAISPQGRLFIEPCPDTDSTSRDDPALNRANHAFAQSAASGLLHLATHELQASVPVDFAFAREIGRAYLTCLCKLPELEGAMEVPPISPPGEGELMQMAIAAPPMRGLEYLNSGVIAEWWRDLDELVRQEIRASGRTTAEYVSELNPMWRTVGRVTLHLAENKRDIEYPFAFLGTYTHRLSAQGRAKHLPLGTALQEYASAKDRAALLSLLQPIQRAAERCDWLKELVESREIYQPLAWTPREAYGFLKDIPVLEECGLIVRVPDWWKAARPPRPVVSVKVGDRAKSKLGAAALLDFNVRLTLEGEPLSEAEMEAILASAGGLVSLKGKWVEVDPEKLKQALKHWKNVEQGAQGGGISFFEGMRLLAGASIETDAAAQVPEASREWVGITASESLTQVLRELRDPDAAHATAPPGLHAELRPYQQIGVQWLRFLTRLGLGACLADDMGLGKTIQVIGLLLHLKNDGVNPRLPSLLVVPASLIANWKAELCRFAPSLTFFIAHPSEDEGKKEGVDLVITTYTMLTRLEWLCGQKWNLAILDEAQAIKNSGTRQTRSVKLLHAAARIALTGTPVENRLSDLWSIFDFLNPGLLGGAKAFAKFVKELTHREHNPYAPLRTLVQPYILRRLKTDKTVIADLPDKTEIKAFCQLSRKQAALYEQAVRELAKQLADTTGIQRKGLVLSFLMRFAFVNLIWPTLML